MGYRLSKIITRTGDKGETGLADGSRVGKDSLRIEAIGQVDELNAVIGWLRCETLPQAIDDELQQLQHDLFNLGGELCLPGASLIDEGRVLWLETIAANHQQHLSPLKDFILPGGSRAAAAAHLLRTVCRRAERCLVALHHTDALKDPLLCYINRLSDYAFILARRLNQLAAIDDVLWQKPPPPESGQPT